MSHGSKKVASASIQMALSETRDEESRLKKRLAEQDIHAAAVDFGGDYLSSINKFVERAIVAGKRENIIGDTHSEEGAIAGATREALSQVMAKAIGLSVGGKLGIARSHDHISIAVFLSIGLLHLDEIAIGLAHRTIS